MPSSRERFWSAYYADVVRTRDPWLDYSNEHVQVQTFGLAIEAAGPVRGRQCLDVGCGWGDVCRALLGLRASAVTGIDIVPELVAEHQQSDPQIRWLCGTLEDDGFVWALGQFDIAFLLEVLQLMPLEATLRRVWGMLRPGGRLVAMVPNARCPIVSRVRDRFDANYVPPSDIDIEAILSSLPEIAHWSYRGLWFGRDQRLVPYDVSEWRPHGAWGHEPNRIQFVALKHEAAAP